MSRTALTRVALGVLLLGRPSLPVRLMRTLPSRRTLAIVRLLGGRYLAQGGVDLAVPHDRRIDAGVEVLHAASMLPLAYVERRHARLALLSAGVAVALAVADQVGGAA